VRGVAADWLIGLTEEADPLLRGPEQARWFAAIEAEYPNLAATLRMLEDCGDGRRLLRLAGALGWFWFRRSRFTEARRWLERGIALAGEDALPAHCAKAHHALALIERCTGGFFVDNSLVRAHAREALRLWHDAGESVGTALALSLLGSDEAEDQYWTKSIFSLSGEGVGHVDEAVAAARGSGDAWATAWCMRYAYTWVYRRDLDVETMRSRLEETLRIARQSGDRYLVCQVLIGMGNVLQNHGQLVEAQACEEEALRIAREIDDRWSTLAALYGLGSLSFDLAHRGEARRWWREGLLIAVEIGARAYLGNYFGGFDYLARKENRPRRATKLMAMAVHCIDPHQTFERVSAEERLGPDFGAPLSSLEAEWRAGQAMTLEEAVAYALSDAD
jgi:tetratricopeptide (TPR) repeat protein